MVRKDPPVQVLRYACQNAARKVTLYEGCCSARVEQHPSHRTHTRSPQRGTPDLQTTTTLGQCTTLL
jgi:hypothetical protein